MKKLIFILLIYASLTAQTDWSTPRTVSGVYSCSESAIAIDNNGVLSAVWCKKTDIGADYYGSVYFSQSFNGGLSWTAEQNITPDYFIDPIWEIRAVTDSDNNIHIIYCKGLAMDKLVYKKYDGVSWSDDYVINFGLDTNLRFDIDSTDRLFATWSLSRTTYYMDHDANIDSINWSTPQIIHPSIDYTIKDFAFDRSNNIHAILKIYTDDSLFYGPFTAIFNKQNDQWQDFEEISNYQESNIGCALAISNQDTIYANISVGPYIDENIDLCLKKNMDDSLWTTPVETGATNNWWNRKMFIDSKNIIHIFEINEESSIYSLNHTYGKGTSWQNETIFSDSDYFIFWFDVKRKVFESYDQYYVLYCLSRGVDGVSYSRINFQTKQVSTGIENSDDVLINNYKIEQNYPNPFNSSTNISYSLQANCEVKISIYNTKGEFVQNLVNERQEKGKHSIIFDASTFKSGVYYYRLSTNGMNDETKKMLYLR